MRSHSASDLSLMMSWVLVWALLVGLAAPTMGFSGISAGYGSVGARMMLQGGAHVGTEVGRGCFEVRLGRPGGKRLLGLRMQEGDPKLAELVRKRNELLKEKEALLKQRKTELVLDISRLEREQQQRPSPTEKSKGAAMQPGSVEEVPSPSLPPARTVPCLSFPVGHANQAP